MKLVLLDEWSPIMNTADSALFIINNACWVLAATFALIGALKVYKKWQLNAHHFFQADTELMIWFFGMIFFIIAHFALGMIFNLNGKGF